MRIGTTQLCSKALIQIERSKRSTYNQAQFINYAMLCRGTRICFTNHGTKSQHVTKVESDIRKIDNRCCYRIESELTVQTRNTCYQLQKIVLVFFSFSFGIILLFVLWQFITLRQHFQISTGSHVKIARRTATKADAKLQHESLLES